MINRIRVKNFKSLRDVDLKLGRMNLFVGTNASGKSNFLDVLRVLQGVGNAFTISEILDGKPASATNIAWNGIRGGSRDARFWKADENASGEDISLEVHGNCARRNDQTPPGVAETQPDERRLSWKLQISFSPAAGSVTRERLETDGGVIYDTNDARDQRKGRKWLAGLIKCPVDRIPGLSVSLYPARPALTQIEGGVWNLGENAAEDWAALWAECRRDAQGVAGTLANIQHVEPELRKLREYSQAFEVQRMGERGENFAALIRTICNDENAKEAYLSWLRELRPEEVGNVGTKEGAEGEPRFFLQENDRDVMTTVLSNGTLRFAALAAAFFQPDMPELVTIEEVENGIHASRARLLLELMRSQAEAADTQVLATTHAGTVLDWLEEEDYRTTFICKRDEETGESRICPLTDVPDFVRVARKTPVSELLSEGWMEAVL